MERNTKVRPNLSGMESTSNDNIAEATIQRKMLRSFLPDYELCSMATLCNGTTQTDLIGDEVYHTGDKYTIWTSQMELPEKKDSFTSINNSDEEEFFSDIGVDETYLMPDFIGIKLSLRPRILLKDTKKTVTVLVNAESLVRDEIKLKISDWPTGDFYLSVGDFQIFPNRSTCLPHYIMITTDFRKFSLDEPMFYGVDPQHAEREKAAWRKKERVHGERSTCKGKKKCNRNAKRPSSSFSIANTDISSLTESLDTFLDKKKTQGETQTKQVDTSDLIAYWESEDIYYPKQTKQNVISSGTQTLVHIHPSSVSDSEYTDKFIKHYPEDFIEQRSDYPDSTETAEERQDALLTVSNNLNSDNTMMDISDLHDATGSVLPSEEQSSVGETEEDVSEITERGSKTKGSPDYQINHSNKDLFSYNFDVVNSNRSDQGTYKKDPVPSNFYGGKNLEDISNNLDHPSQLPKSMKTNTYQNADSFDKSLNASDNSSQPPIDDQKTNVFPFSENLEAQEKSLNHANHFLKTYVYPNADSFNKSLEAYDNSQEPPTNHQKTNVLPFSENLGAQENLSQLPNPILKSYSYANAESFDKSSEAIDNLSELPVNRQKSSIYPFSEHLETEENSSHFPNHIFKTSSRPDQGTYKKDPVPSNVYGGKNLEDISNNLDHPSQLPKSMKTNTYQNADSFDKSLNASDSSSQPPIDDQKTNVFPFSEKLEAQGKSLNHTNHFLKTYVYPNADSFNKSSEASDNSSELPIDHQKTNVLPFSENLEAQENSSQLPHSILKSYTYPNAESFNKSLEASNNSSGLPIDHHRAQDSSGSHNLKVQFDSSQFPHNETQNYPSDADSNTPPTANNEKPTDTLGSTFGRRPSLLKAMVAVEEEISPLISDLTRISNEFKSIELTPDMMPSNLPPLHTPNATVLPLPKPDEPLSLSSGRPSDNLRHSSRTLYEFYKNLGICPTFLGPQSETNASQDFGQEVGADGTTSKRSKVSVPPVIQNPYLSLQEVQEELARPYDRRSKDYKPASVWSDPDQFLRKPPPD